MAKRYNLLSHLIRKIIDKYVKKKDSQSINIIDIISWLLFVLFISHNASIKMTAPNMLAALNIFLTLNFSSEF